MPTTAIRDAQNLAVQKLTEILRDSDDPVQIRLTSELLLRLTPEEPEAPSASAHPPTPPAAEPVPPAPASPRVVFRGPLASEELAALRRLLPNVRPERFNKRADHWRSILAQFGRSPPAAASQTAVFRAA